MNIDERLEALTHSVELLAGMQRAEEQRADKLAKQIGRLGKYVRAVAQLVLEHETRIRVLEGDDDSEDEGNGKNPKN